MVIEPALIQLALLEVGEVESAVADDRAAEARAVLRLRQRQLGVGKRIGGVEALVAEVAVQVAMQRVGAALGDHVDVAAERAPELGLAARGDHLKFLHHVEAVEDAAQSGGIVVGGKAIHDEVVGEIALAADRDSLAGHGGGFGEELVAGGVGGRDAGNQQREIEEVAPVERQVGDLGLRHGARDLAARRFEHRRLAADGDVGRGRRDGERDRQFKSGAHRERQPARRRRKTPMPDADLVRPDLEVGKTETSFPIRDRGVGKLVSV